MLKHTYLVFLILLTTQFVYAQAFALPAHQNAMGNIKASALGQASFGNPASNVHYQGFTAFATVENRFIGTDIKGISIGGAYTAERLGSIHFGVNRIGIEGLHIQEIAVGYARKIGKQTSIGGSLLLFNRLADQYEKSQVISFNIGTQFALSENIHAGVLISNPFPDRKESPSYNFNSEIAFGVTWRLPKLTSSFEIVKPQHTKYTLKTGIDYRPAKSISILGGVVLSEQDLRPSLGLTYRLKHLALTMSGAFYNQLSPGASVGLVYAVHQE